MATNHDHFILLLLATNMRCDKSDLDIDDNVSHVEGSTTVMSAGESETDSDNDQLEMEFETAETPYIHTPEDEFGDVSSINLWLLDFSNNLIFCPAKRPENKSRNSPRNTKA